MRRNCARRTAVLIILLILVIESSVSGQTTSDTVPFSFGANAGVVISLPSGSQSAGYAKLQPDASSPTPVMMEVLGSRSGGSLVSETVIPAASTTMSGRLYSRMDTASSMGIAIANPNNQSAAVTFYFTDQNGTDLPGGSLTVPANGQVTSFFSQLSSSAAVSSTFTFSSAVPVSVNGLRQVTNDRGQSLLTSVPVAPVQAISTDTMILPYFVTGGGYAERVVLINPTNSSMTGTAQLRTAQGGGMNVSVNGVTNSTFDYSIPAKSSFEFISDAAAALVVGSARFSPTPGSSSPAIFSIASFKTQNTIVTEFVVPASPAGSAFRTYAETSGVPFSAGGIITGVVVANPDAAPAIVDFTLMTVSGSTFGQTTKTIAARGQSSLFLADLFTGLPGTIQGVLRIATTAPAGIVTEGLRFHSNERNDLLISGVPAIAEAGAVNTVLPSVTVGPGFSSEIVLFGQAPGPTNSGTIKFVSQSGGPMVFTSGDVKAPAVTITNPTNGAAVVGVINVTASASDDVGVSGVQFLLDGAPLGAEDTTAPYSVTWNTATSTNGAHVITAVARDAAGNRGTSSAVSVTVNNVSTTPTMSRIGSFAQIASGGGWKTTLTLANLSSVSIKATVSFHSDDGSALTLPLVLSNGLSLTGSSADLTIPARGSVVIESESSSSSASTGWAAVQATGSLAGNAIFRLRQSGSADSEGTTPLETTEASSISFTFDNTSGFQTAVALANLGTTDSVVTANFRDENGIALGSSQFTLSGSGHTSFFVNGKFSATAGRRGTIEFQSAAGAVTGVGLRFSPALTFTSVPILR